MNQEILDLIEGVPAATEALRSQRNWLRFADRVLADVNSNHAGLEEDMGTLRGLAADVRERVTELERAAEEAARAAEAAEQEAREREERERREQAARMEREAQEEKEREDAAKRAAAESERARLTAERIRARERARVASGTALPAPPVVEVPPPPAKPKARQASPPPYTPIAGDSGEQGDDDDIVMTGVGIAAPGTEFPSPCVLCRRAGTKCVRASGANTTSCRRCVEKKARCDRGEANAVRKERKRTRQDSGATPVRASKRTSRETSGSQGSQGSGRRYVLPRVVGQAGSSTEEEEALTVEEITQRMLDAVSLAQYYGVLLSRSSGDLKVRRANGSLEDANTYLRWGVRAVEGDGGRTSRNAMRRGVGPSDGRSERGGDDDDGEGEEEAEEEEEEESVASGSGKGKGRAK
ncbi:hypothetical protein BOTBODRAFT_173343 [Botryobasidium botryosum FD-172 SS1]|uniref:Uncharacterized protein n=1 Tax=Botryobasidium botryosum (strain FD-172 SS1) TaxID=930990 RepID=A0A067MKI3_BOTB1|nr:hypothetical protein BOTBODRAFT_173343 [Botryobasidium botryosum FD-172 SS1]